MITIFHQLRTKSDKKDFLTITVSYYLNVQLSLPPNDLPVCLGNTGGGGEP